MYTSPLTGSTATAPFPPPVPSVLTTELVRVEITDTVLEPSSTTYTSRLAGS